MHTQGQVCGEHVRGRGHASLRQWNLTPMDCTSCVSGQCHSAAAQ